MIFKSYRWITAHRQCFNISKNFNLQELRKEIVINRSRVPRIIYYLVLVLIIGSAVQSAYDGKIIKISILSALGIGWFFTAKHRTSRAQPLIKISDDCLWTRNRGNKYWSSILCIKFRYTGQYETYMDIYMSNEYVADEEVSLREVEMATWRLKRILKRYTRVGNH